MRALPLVHNSNVKNLNQKVEAERKRMENVRDTLFSKLIDDGLENSEAMRLANLWIKTRAYLAVTTSK